MTIKRLFLYGGTLMLLAGILCAPVALAMEATVVVDVHASDIQVDDILTVDELALMQSQEVYQVGYLPNFQPMSYLDDQGNLCGTAVDVFSAIADALDITVEYVNLEEEGASIADVDICLSQQSAATGGIVLVGNSYFDMPYILIYDNDTNMSDDLPVAILAYYDISVIQGEYLLMDDTLVSCTNFETMNQNFSNNTIKGMILTTARYNALKNDIDHVGYSIDLLSSYYGCSFSYPSSFSAEKIAIMDKMLDYLDDATVSYSILTHSSYDSLDEVNFWETLIKNPIHILQFGILIGLLLTTSIAIGVTISGRKRKADLERMVNVDSVTGLATLHKFETTLAQLLEENPTVAYTIFSLDIDNFKYINDFYGYEIGTKVLQTYGNFLTTIAPKAPVISRCFADQFLVLLESEKLKYAYLTGEEHFLEDGFAKAGHPLGEGYDFSHSVGYFHIQDTSLPISYMCNCAKLAKDLGKKTVGLTVFGFTEEMAREMDNTNHIVTNMKKAITNHEFVVYYQPKIHLQTEEVVGAEALVRWMQEGVLVPPDAFIPIFEKNGFIKTLDHYVIQEVCHFIKSQPVGTVPVISVNISGVTMMSDDFIEKLTTTVDAYGIPPCSLDLEITESALVDHLERITQKIQQLRTMGFTIAMDDFGVGISSLSRLKHIPLDTLKIDRLFIADAVNSETGTAIVSHIIGLANSLHLDTVAEGVETPQQIQFFRDLGCTIGQGFGYSYPLPEEDFLSFLSNHM